MGCVAFDFDGVISDSVRECYVVALRTYLAIEGESTLAKRSSVSSLLADGEIGKLETDPVFAEFVRLMPYGNRAEDFGVALAAIDRGHGIASQSGYDELYRTFSQEWLDAFHRRFYQVRHDLQANRPRLWTSLQRPYPEVVEAILRRAGELPLAIATAKDRSTVRLQLREYGLDGVFPSELVLDKETGVSKRAHLERLRDLLGTPVEAITFVDDKLRHLEAVAGLGVRCVLAGWGYNGPQERRQAIQVGFAVCTLEDMEEVVFGSARHGRDGNPGGG